MQLDICFSFAHEMGLTAVLCRDDRARMNKQNSRAYPPAMLLLNSVSDFTNGRGTGPKGAILPVSAGLKWRVQTMPSSPSVPSLSCQLLVPDVAHRSSLSHTQERATKSATRRNTFWELLRGFGWTLVPAHRVDSGPFLHRAMKSRCSAYAGPAPYLALPFAYNLSSWRTCSACQTVWSERLSAPEASTLPVRSSPLPSLA